MHSEYNRNKDQPVKFLQILVFPNEKRVKPRYDQISLGAESDMEILLMEVPMK
jgi:quercetin 2,3-dioxygenase